MGRIVMKEAPHVDFYVEWSSVVEAPTAWGNRVFMLRHISEQVDSYLRDDAPHHPARRMERADDTGTTSRWVTEAGMRDRYPEEGAWDDSPKIFMQRGLLSRPNIFVAARRLGADPGDPITDLLTPLDDEDEVRTP